MKKRSIGIMVLLFFVTLGIYAIVWQCKFQGELKNKTGEGMGPWGHFFASIFTFGIYSIIWSFLAGKRLVKAGASSDFSILYLILTLCFGIGSIINMFVMQNQANSIVEVAPTTLNQTPDSTQPTNTAV